jgi:prepilin signal peptidase PulO-like enzyme (type II secretory pathway)
VGGIPVFIPGDWWLWVKAGLLALTLIQVAVTDMRTRYVYTVVALIGLCLGLAFGWQVHHVDWWTGLAGAAGGFGSFGALYLFGLLFARVRDEGRVEPMARGDIGTLQWSELAPQPAPPRRWCWVYSSVGCVPWVS